MQQKSDERARRKRTPGRRMDATFLSTLTKARRQELLQDLNYLNTAEIKSFCKKHSIPYAIFIETRDGRKRTNEDDRKGVILNRIRHFLETGMVLEETCFRAGVVCFDPLPARLTGAHRLRYGQYDKKHHGMMALLKQLTDGKFKNGAIARILARDFWTGGKAPTFKEFASAWLRAAEEHTKPNPEWAFLSDKASGKDSSNWKKLRTRKASKVLAILEGAKKARPKPGDTVILMKIPPGFLDDLLAEDQQAIVQVVGKPIRLNEYDGDDRVELEFIDDNNVTHFIYVRPRFIKLAE